MESQALYTLVRKWSLWIILLFWHRKDFFTVCGKLSNPRIIAISGSEYGPEDSHCCAPNWQTRFTTSIANLQEMKPESIKHLKNYSIHILPDFEIVDFSCNKNKCRGWMKWSNLGRTGLLILSEIRLLAMATVAHRAWSWEDTGLQSPVENFQLISQHRGLNYKVAVTSTKTAIIVGSRDFSNVKKPGHFILNPWSFDKILHPFLTLFLIYVSLKAFQRLQ